MYMAFAGGEGTEGQTISKQPGPLSDTFLV